jgi:hypothetical protein
VVVVPNGGGWRLVGDWGGVVGGSWSPKKFAPQLVSPAVMGKSSYG